jgi:predicted outer membrane protein
MKATPILATIFATSSLFALSAVVPAAEQTYTDPIITDPIIVTPADPMAMPGTPYSGVQSAKTAGFVANVVPNVNFLNEASRLALSNSGNVRVRQIAHRVASQETLAGNAMTAWAETNPPIMTGRSAYGGALSPITGLPATPINIIIGNGLTAGAIVASSDGHILLRSQADDLARLSALQGRDFDSLYKQTQIDALQQLAMVYGDYAAGGDDPALVAFAARELPKTRARILELNRI